ncbi:hypothetical protein ADK75_13270 [Streptomyces virginiae]|uniref:Uncharacterized protein n=1 Tax=Streptomyces virginiae TaxID=1961 RepID=A0A0L8MWL0_STRVG|nr:hypothetical protein ADK75_13270 [Streptomyces virginiae]
MFVGGAFTGDDLVRAFLFRSDRASACGAAPHQDHRVVGVVLAVVEVPAGGSQGRVTRARRLFAQGRVEDQENGLELVHLLGLCLDGRFFGQLQQSHVVCGLRGGGASRENRPCGRVRVDGVWLASFAPGGTVWLNDLDDVDLLSLQSPGEGDSVGPGALDACASQDTE